MNATISPSELPSDIVRTNCELITSATAAMKPAVTDATLHSRLASRAPSRNASDHREDRAARARRRATGPAPRSPNSEKTVVNSTGSGFHDGPPVVCRSRWTISRPQTIQAHGSYVGVLG